jgi:hypothetical protein
MLPSSVFFFIPQDFFALIQHLSNWRITIDEVVIVAITNVVMTMDLSG